MLFDAIVVDFYWCKMTGEIPSFIWSGGTVEPDYIVHGCKVSPIVWSIFFGQNADLTSGRDCKNIRTLYGCHISMAPKVPQCQYAMPCLLVLWSAGLLNVGSNSQWIVCFPRHPVPDTFFPNFSPRRPPPAIIGLMLMDHKGLGTTICSI